MNTQRPTETKSADSWDTDATKFDHPAFGSVSVSRWHGGKHRLFGSDLSHSSGITLKVSRATLERHLSHDRHSSVGQEEIVELTMSEVQWARLVASSGMGDGVPVTLTHYGNQCIPAISEPSATKKEVFAEEMRASTARAIESLKQSIASLESAVESKSLSKKTLRDIVSSVKVAVANLPGNLAFVSETFQRETESATENAKAEIEAYANATVLKIGSDVAQELQQMARFADGKPNGL